MYFPSNADLIFFCVSPPAPNRVHCCYDYSYSVVLRRPRVSIADERLSEEEVELECVCAGEEARRRLAVHK